MKKVNILMAAWLQLIAFPVLSQQETGIWQLGTGKADDLSFYLDFSSGNVDTGTVIRQMNFFTANASICDSAGQLLFYTNGVWLANINHDTLFNSQDFNPGFATDYYGQDDDGLGLVQAAIILPLPGSENKYNIFYVTAELTTAHGWVNQAQPLYLSMSEIDMSLDGELGGMVAGNKNIHVIEDTVTQGRITACKHANGRDWWVISHKFYSDVYYILLKTPDSTYLTSQQIGSIFNSDDIFGMAVFSPDGNKYAHLNINDTIEYLQFDRCTGKFSDFIKLSVPDTSTLSATLGCSFSPNNRFLYVSTYWSLYQFDTWANDIQSSIIKVGAWEDQTGWPDWFFLHQLASDAKIYIGLWGASNWLHVINDPDNIGLACNFVQHGLALPAVDANFSVPNFANYDLVSLSGSPCDTLYNQTPTLTTLQNNFRLQPNPASELLNIIYQTDKEITATITDAFGREVKRFTLYPWFKNRIVYVDDLPAGVYLLTLSSHSRKQTMKLIVAK